MNGSWVDRAGAKSYSKEKIRRRFWIFVWLSVVLGAIFVLVIRAMNDVSCSRDCRPSSECAGSAYSVAIYVLCSVSLLRALRLLLKSSLELRAFNALREKDLTKHSYSYPIPIINVVTSTDRDNLLSSDVLHHMIDIESKSNSCASQHEICSDVLHVDGSSSDTSVCANLDFQSTDDLVPTTDVNDVKSHKSDDGIGVLHV